MPAGFEVDYDAQAATYDTTRAASPSVVEPLLAALGSPATGDVVLDLGGGTGNYALAVGRAGWRPLVVDRSSAMLTRAARKGLAVAHGEATKLPVRSRVAAAVILVSMLHQVPDWRSALAEARRVLQPGGRLVVMVYSRENAVASWLLDYFPSSRPWMVAEHPRLADYLAQLPDAQHRIVHFRDTVDQSVGLLRRHPAWVLDPTRRAQTSYFERLARTDREGLQQGLQRLAADLDAGRLPVTGDLPDGDATVIRWHKPSDEG